MKHIELLTYNKKVVSITLKNGKVVQGVLNIEPQFKGCLMYDRGKNITQSFIRFTANKVVNVEVIK